MVRYTKLHKQLSLNVKKVLYLLSEKGFVAVVAGGAVRDLLIDEVPHDWDIVTSATPSEAIGIFEKAGYRAFATDKEVSFGRCSTIIDGEEFEITTLRLDGNSSNSRHPDEVTFTEDLEEDSARRDFTINALYLDCIGKLYDFHFGIEDVVLKKVIFVGNPFERLEEDALRLLRYFRFLLRFDAFNENNIEFIQTNIYRLRSISVERIKIEMDKIFTERKKDTMQQLFDTGIVDCLFGTKITSSVVECKQVTKWHPEVLLTSHINKVFNKYIDSGVFCKEMPWIVLMHDLGKPECIKVRENGTTSFHEHELASIEIAEAFMGIYKFSNEEKEVIFYVISEHMRISSITKMKTSKAKRYVQDKHFCVLKAFHNYDDMVEERSPDTDYIDQKIREWANILKPLVVGKDLIEYGLKPGEHFGSILKRMLDLQYENDFSTKEEVMNAYFNNGKGELDA